MKILGLRSIGVRGVADGAYDFAREGGEPHGIVLVVGEPGAGKTRLLELIVACREVLAPSDERIDHESFVRRGNHTAKAIVRFWLEPDERATVGAPSPVVETEVIFGVDDVPPDPSIVFLLSAYGHDDQTPKLEYFGERRRLDFGGGDMSLEESTQLRFRTSDSPRKFAFLPAFLARLPHRPEQASRFAAGLAGLSLTCRYDVEHHALVSGRRPLRHLGELSASEADAVTFAATAALVGLSRSVVLVDSPELHGLDPRRALAGIASLGADNQLVVVTSSPELVASAKGAVLRLAPTSTRF